MNITKSAALLVAGMATLTVACSTTGTSTPAGSTTSSKAAASSSTTQSTSHPGTATNAEPVASTNNSTTNSPASSPAETGNIVVHVSDLDGGRLGDIEVKAFRVGPCDPSHYEMPPVDGFAESLEERTDGSGTVVFEQVTLGCWSVTATVPAGYSRVEATRASVFLVDGGDTAEANLQLQRGMTDPCGGEGLANAMGEDVITDAYCDGSWALVSAACGPDDRCENGPNDNTRILRVAGDRWVTYTALPSTMCLSTAKHDGVPTKLQLHFNPNC
ncbi:MAG: hypothetical protein LLG14_15965 [Nocardiaceae bacterium]|nr:hypothetical protein [Nocardiaceae bacterium]